MKNQIKANWSLVLVAMFWGASCLLTKVGLEALSEINLIALRFLIAFGITYATFRNKIRIRDKILLKKASILALVLFCVFLFMSYGVRNTTASNAGFLTCLAGVFIPFINRFLFKEPIKGRVYISVLVALIGVGMLTLDASFKIGVGDVLCILCSMLFGFHIILTSKLTQDADPLSLSVAQLGFVGLYALAATFIFESPQLPTNTSGWFVVIILSVFCSAFAFIIQTIAQRHTTPVYTGLIYSLEPVFAAVFSFLFLGEILKQNGYIGAIVLLVSILIVEMDFTSLHELVATGGKKA